MNNLPGGKPCPYAALLAYIVAAVGALLIVGGLAWITYAYTRPEPLTEDRAALRRKNLAELRASVAEVLNNPNYIWQDQAKGTVHLPVERSMELVQRLYQNPAAGRTNLIARAEKANAKLPDKPNPFE